GLVYCLVRGGGGCEIRTREGLPPTRFPTLLAGVRTGSPPSVTCQNAGPATAGERCRTGVNETRTETRHRVVPGGRAAARWCAVSVEAISWARPQPGNMTLA